MEQFDRLLRIQGGMLLGKRLLEEYGQAIADDDSIVIEPADIKSDLALICTVLAGDCVQKPSDIRDELGLCPMGKGHWAPLCSVNRCVVNK